MAVVKADPSAPLTKTTARQRHLAACARALEARGWCDQARPRRCGLDAGGVQRDASAQIIAELEQMVSYWRDRARKDEALLAATQGTERNTQAIAQNTQAGHTMGHEPVYPSSAPAATAVRGAGGFHVMRRV